jgi:hypothetical protein
VNEDALHQRFYFEICKIIVTYVENSKNNGDGEW